jgi:hypothetical protein
MPIEQLLIVSDTHCGSKFGLCDPEGIPVPDDEPPIVPSKLATQLWNECWLPSNEWADANISPGCALLINGDTIEGVNNKNREKNITNLFNRQQELAVKALGPLASKIKAAGGHVLGTYGTEWHAGASGESDISVCKALGATKILGTYAPPVLSFRMANGAILDIKHHGPVQMPVQELSIVLAREYQNRVMSQQKAGLEAPHLCIRSHGHTYRRAGGYTPLTDEVALMTPGWKLMDPYGYKVACARNSNLSIGLVLLEIENGVVMVRNHRYDINTNPIIDL